ncbi:MAG: hypothetical protein HY064_13520 [Bacteroidetes bacterium]|nr:hypothetical protein [Bacteroidota bacterium]
MNYSRRSKKNDTGQEPDKKHFHLFTKAASTDRKTKRSAKRAEKGEKKERDKTKPEKKFQLFRRKKQGEHDAADQDKGTFKPNDAKEKKTRKKRSKHPQLGLWPNGHPG